MTVDWEEDGEAILFGKRGKGKGKGKRGKGKGERFQIHPLSLSP
jgi:hypothetical protein